MQIEIKKIGYVQKLSGKYFTYEIFIDSKRISTLEYMKSEDHVKRLIINKIKEL
jgi:hypothetical protein